MNRTNLKLLAIALLLALCLCGCAGQQVEFQNSATGLLETAYLAENDALKDSDRAALDQIRTAFETALATQSAADLMPFVDQSLAADEETLTAFFKSVAESGEEPHVFFDEYYVRGLTEDVVPVQVKKQIDDETSIQIVPAGKELYVALYASGKNAPVSTMISLVCVKKGGAWTLSWIDIGDYQYNGEDANAVYLRAKAAMEEGLVMPALLLAQMTGSLATPGNVLRYANTEIMQEFVYQIASEGLKDHPLPMKLEQSGVTLRSVATAKTELGVVPMFFYSTDTPLENTTALRKEAERVYREIGELFPGTTQEFPTAELRMTNADPEVEENFNYETVIVSMN